MPVLRGLESGFRVWRPTRRICKSYSYRRYWCGCYRNKFKLSWKNQSHGKSVLPKMIPLPTRQILQCLPQQSDSRLCGYVQPSGIWRFQGYTAADHIGTLVGIFLWSLPLKPVVQFETNWGIVILPRGLPVP